MLTKSSPIELPVTSPQVSPLVVAENLFARVLCLLMAQAKTEWILFGMLSQVECLQNIPVPQVHYRN